MMGDQALIQVSAAIRNAVRSRDIVARFGGEEFMVLLTSSSAENALQAAERIRQRVYDLKIPHMFNESVATNVTISIGMTPLMGCGYRQRAETGGQRALRSQKYGT
ncbi:diguanylate cyclase [Klebsiella michiganensis]|uniref:diguanylate cyclase n=1 Tax=Klebsiella michiganensis TaxID=1134687 RepID=A0A7H4N891_9ENTR|nr:diguanylate cyclase [Klebsiella michiganensis]